MYQTGDIVLLKSGGPMLTVKHGNRDPAGITEDDPSQEVYVAWFDGGEKREAVFFASQLISGK